MGRPKRNIIAAAEESSTPPSALTSTQTIAKVISAKGNNLYAVLLPAIFAFADKEAQPTSTQSDITSTIREGTTNEREILVELPSRFRNTIWIKRGGYLLVDTKEGEERENKIGGEVVTVVRDEKSWRRTSYWPVEFKKISAYEESDDEESTVGKMPPSDSEEE